VIMPGRVKLARVRETLHRLLPECGQNRPERGDEDDRGKGEQCPCGEQEVKIAAVRARQPGTVPVRGAPGDEERRNRAERNEGKEHGTDLPLSERMNRLHHAAPHQIGG